VETSALLGVTRHRTRWKVMVAQGIEIEPMAKKLPAFLCCKQTMIALNFIITNFSALFSILFPYK
jgi:hypothetical protein